MSSLRWFDDIAVARARDLLFTHNTIVYFTCLRLRFMHIIVGLHEPLINNLIGLIFERNYPCIGISLCIQS